MHLYTNYSQNIVCISDSVVCDNINFFTKQNINNTNPLNFSALDLKVIIYSNKSIGFIQTKVLDLFKKCWIY
jgi:hypothetical protein